MKADIGTIRVSQNGYEYTKVGEGDWRLTHHIIAEQKYGRPLKEGDRVKFVDGDRSNLHPDNIEIVKKTNKAKEEKIALLRARIEKLQAQLAQLDDLESS